MLVVESHPLQITDAAPACTGPVRPNDKSRANKRRGAGPEELRAAVFGQMLADALYPIQSPSLARVSGGGFL